MTAAVVDEQVDMDINYAAVVPCQTWVEPCLVEATWVLIRNCCQARHTMCAEHSRRSEESWDYTNERANGVICDVCEAAPMPRPTWRPL